MTISMNECKQRNNKKIFPCLFVEYMFDGIFIDFYLIYIYLYRKNFSRKSGTVRYVFKIKMSIHSIILQELFSIL